MSKAGSGGEFFNTYEQGIFAAVAEKPTDGFVVRDDVRPIVDFDVAWDDEPENAGPWLVAQGSTATRIPILRNPKRLLNDFERASADPTDNAILKLANRYGWLRGAVTLVDPRFKGRLKGVVLRDGDLLLGEHVGDWRSELALLCDLFEVWNAVRALETEDPTPQAVRSARMLLRRRIRQSKTGAVGYVNDQLGTPRRFAKNRHLLIPGLPGADNVAEYFEPDLELRAARYYLSLELNDALRDGWAYPVLMPLRQDVIRFFPRAALAAVHLSMMLKLSGGVPERACARCGLLFEARPVHKQYCSRSCKESASHRRSTRRARSAGAELGRPPGPT